MFTVYFFNSNTEALPPEVDASQVHLFDLATQEVPGMDAWVECTVAFHGGYFAAWERCPEDHHPAPVEG